MLNNNDNSYIKSNPEGIQNEIFNNADNKRFQFSRHKSIGRLDISHFITNVSINNTTLALKQQKIILYFFKKTPFETIHNITDITSIKLVRTFDISDTIFSITFFLLGFFQPISFIFAILFFWIAIGKKIELKKSNNSTISIPTENSKRCSELVQTLVSINRGIVIENIN